MGKWYQEDLLHIEILGHLAVKYLRKTSSFFNPINFLAVRNLMLEQTIRLFIKALIIGVLINLSIQHVSTTPLPYSKNVTQPGQAFDHAPLKIQFHTTSQAEK